MTTELTLLIWSAVLTVVLAVIAVLGAMLQVDVFTDRWYQQGPLITPDLRTGRFSRRVILGGEGAQRCAHVVRVRLLGVANRIVDEVTASRIVRTSSDSTATPCLPVF